MNVMISKGKLKAQDGQYLLRLRWWQWEGRQLHTQIKHLRPRSSAFLGENQQFYKLTCEGDINRPKSVHLHAFSSREVKDVSITHKTHCWKQKVISQHTAKLSNWKCHSDSYPCNKRHEVHAAIYILTTAVIKEGSGSRESHMISSALLGPLRHKSIVNKHLISTEKLTIIPEI